MAVEIHLSASPLEDEAPYGHVPRTAEEFHEGLYLVGPHRVAADSQGWSGTTDLVGVGPDAALGTPAPRPLSHLDHTGGPAISSHPEIPRPVAPDRECDTNPYRLWALDQESRAFVVHALSNGMLRAPSVYGGSLHPGRFRADVPLPSSDGPPARLRVRSIVAAPGEPDQVWLVGSRAAIEAASPVPLPPVVVPDWIVRLHPVDGGESFPVITGRTQGVVVLRPAAATPPGWPQDNEGRVVVEDGGTDPDALRGRTITVRREPFRSGWRHRPETLGRYFVE